ncbi:hypothetical protein NP233_g9335 [Leucocoprinus birnbaumii]|uniref:NADAR domain-containing protein n=1 Tax=Leucocoprinus birnbaumii TaxID=56174 RepID=A0AAD5VKM5_9AGAR|nr:hypothetical protein NP233_g9335 [Leucocoprinus birnbaumii]
MTTESRLKTIPPRRPLTSVQDRVDFLQGPLAEGLIANITGNAPQEIKELPVKWLMIYRARGNSFSCQIADRIKVVDVSVVPNVDDPLKNDGRVTTEIEVTPDMCNAQGVLHDGCKVFLIDECSATVLTTINAFEGHGFMSGVSQTMNVLFHAPATIRTTAQRYKTSDRQSLIDIRERDELVSVRDMGHKAQQTSSIRHPDNDEPLIPASMVEIGSYFVDTSIDACEGPHVQAPPAPAPAQPAHQPTVAAPAPTNVQPAPPGMLDNLPPGFVPTSITPNPPGVSGQGPVIPPNVSGNSNAQGAVPPPLFTPGVPGNAQLTDLPSSEPPPILRRAATPFHPGQAQNESDEDDNDDEYDHGRSHSRSHRRAASEPHLLPQLPPITADDPIASPGVRPNPLPAPPRDLYQLSPYKQLLHLPNTMTLLTQTRTANQGAVYPQSNANLSRSATNPGMAGVGAGVNAMQPQTVKKKKKFFSFRRSRDPASQSAPPPPPQHQLGNVHFVPIYQSAPYGQPSSGPLHASSSGLAQPQSQAGPSGESGVRPHTETPVPPVPTPPSPPPQRSPPPDDDEGSDDGVVPPDVYRSISPANGHQTNFGSQQPQSQPPQPSWATPYTQPVIPNQPPPQAPPPPSIQPQTHTQPYPQFSQSSASIQGPYLVSPGGTTMEFSHTSLPDFLNHSHHRVMYANRTYPSAMHLHEAMKFMETKPELAEKIRNTPNVEDVYPLTARLQVWVRPDWSAVFLDKMEEVLLHKFLQHPDLRMMLMKTGNAKIVYSDPADPYWGSGAQYGAGSTFPGTNYLGKLLERVREQLKEQGYTALL